MKETLFLLQAEKINDAAYRLLDYGPLGIYAFITTAGFVALVLVIRKKYERHLVEKDKLIAEIREEKDKVILKLEAKLDACEQRVRYMEEHVIKRLNDSLDHNSDIIALNSIAMNDSASVMNETKGVLVSNGEKLVKILEKVLDQNR
jgi:rRNA maturation endonuclease Nob1